MAEVWDPTLLVLVIQTLAMVEITNPELERADNQKGYIHCY
jgi:hypothetical protein